MHGPSQMKIVYRMAVRNMLPEVVYRAARMANRPISAEEHPDILMKKVEEALELPSEREELRSCQVPILGTSSPSITDPMGWSRYGSSPWTLTRLPTTRASRSRSSSHRDGRSTSTERPSFAGHIRAIRDAQIPAAIGRACCWKRSLTRENTFPPRSLHHIGHFAKVRVASSNLVARSRKPPGNRGFSFHSWCRVSRSARFRSYSAPVW